MSGQAPPAGGSCVERRRDPLADSSLWVALGVYGLLFLLMNARSRRCSFVFFSVNTRLIWLILLSMLLGAGLRAGSCRTGRESRGEKPRS